MRIFSDSIRSYFYNMYNDITTLLMQHRIIEPSLCDAASREIITHTHGRPEHVYETLARFIRTFQICPELKEALTEDDVRDIVEFCAKSVAKQ